MLVSRPISRPISWVSGIVGSLKLELRRLMEQACRRAPLARRPRRRSRIRWPSIEWRAGELLGERVLVAATGELLILGGPLGVAKPSQ